MCDTDFDNEGKRNSLFSISEIKKKVRKPKVAAYDTNAHKIMTAKINDKTKRR